jgi:hypothetical protein
MRYKNVADVIHAFANLSTDEMFTAEGDSRGGNVFFSRGSLYSYGHHFTIARYVKSKTGATILFYNSDSYSITTSGHQSAARQALSHRTLISIPGAGTGTERDVFDRLTREVKPLLDKLAVARKPELYLDKIATLKSAADAYAEHTGAKVPKEFKALCSITDSAEVAEFRKREGARIARERKQAIKAAQEKDAQSIADFRTFKANRIYIADGTDRLRYNAEARRIETTQCVQIPVTYARQFWQMIEYARRTGDYSTIVGFRVLDSFAVRTFDPEKIEIGCHTIPLSEIDAMAAALGWEYPQTGTPQAPAPAQMSEAPAHS